MTNFVNQDGSGLVGGLLPSGVGQAFNLDASGNLKTNIGGALTPSSPAIVESNISNWIRAGQGFAASTGLQTSPGAGTFPFSLFNPLGSGKTLLVFSHKPSQSPNGGTLYLVVANPNYGSTITPSNLSTGSVTTSVASCTFTNTSQVPSSTILEVAQANNQTLSNEQLTSGTIILLPPGKGLIYGVSTGAGFLWFDNMKWIEF